MAELKTKPTGASVEAFLGKAEPARRRAEGKTLVEMMQRVTGCAPVMWGPSIVGFGSYRYEYDSGHKGAYFLTGFSPRKQALTLYIMPGFKGSEALMARLGKHRTGKSCLYLNRLEDVDLAVLEELVRQSVALMREKYNA